MAIWRDGGRKSNPKSHGQVLGGKGRSNWHFSGGHFPNQQKTPLPRKLKHPIAGKPVDLHLELPDPAPQNRVFPLAGPESLVGGAPIAPGRAGLPSRPPVS
jgi:hypothetical protein